MATKPKRMLYALRPGRWLHIPRNMAGNHRVWAKPGQVVDLTHPRLQSLASDQMNKLVAYKGRVRKNTAIVTLENGPAPIRADVERYERAKRGEEEPTELDELAEESEEESGEVLDPVEEAEEEEEADEEIEEAFEDED